MGLNIRKITNSVRQTIEDVFEVWAIILSKYSIVIFLLFLGTYIGIGYSYFTHDTVVRVPITDYIPDNSYIFENIKKAGGFMPFSLFQIETHNKLAIGFESKEEGKLLTLGAFADMIDFDEKLNALQVERDDDVFDYYDDVVSLIDGNYEFPSSPYENLNDLCQKYFDEKRNQEVSANTILYNKAFIQFCKYDGAKPIDAVYDYETGRYDLSQYKNDEELLERIQSGVTEQSVFRRDYIVIDETYSGISPAKLNQNSSTGKNNIESATAAYYGIYPWKYFKLSLGLLAGNIEMEEPDLMQELIM